jgi:hypothetical protein
MMALSAVQQASEIFLVRAAFESDVERDSMTPHELRERHVHRDHAVLSARLEH